MANGDSSVLNPGLYFATVYQSIVTLLGPTDISGFGIANHGGNIVYTQTGVRNNAGTLWAQSPTNPACFSRYDINAEIGLAQFDEPTQQWIVVGARSQHFFVATGPALDQLSAVGRVLDNSGLYSIDYQQNDSLRLYFGQPEGVLFDLALDHTQLDQTSGWTPFCFDPVRLADTCLPAQTFPITRTVHQMQPIGDLGFDTVVTVRDTALTFAEPVEPAFSIDVPACITSDQPVGLAISGDATDVFVTQGGNPRIDSSLAPLDLTPETLNYHPADSLRIDYRFANCPADTTLPYAIDLAPQFDVSPGAIIACDSTSVRADLLIAEGDFVEWDATVSITDPTQVDYPFDRPGSYQGTVANGSCLDTFTFDVTVATDCDTVVVAPPEVTSSLWPEHVFPNAFSPNADGSNDVFGLPPVSRYRVARLQVFDRWGNYVADVEANALNDSAAWDGRYTRAASTAHGGQAASGVYVYVARLRDRLTNAERLEHGDLHLMR